MLYLDRQTDFAGGTATGISGSDLFEDTDDTLLSAHTPTSGAFTWAIVSGTEATTGVKITSNGAQLVASSGNAAFYYIASGLTANHVKATIVNGSTDNQFSLFLRAASASAPGNSLYRAAYWRAGGKVQLFRGATPVGTFVVPTTAGTHTFELDVTNGTGTTATVTVTVDGTDVITYTDSSRLTGTFVGAAWGAASGAAISSSMSDIEFTGGSTLVSSRYELPYSVATDGSEGTVQVVTADGTVLTSTRPDSTHVQVDGDFSTTAVTIGLQYTFTVTLSPIIYRPALRFGDPTATLSGRLQLRWMDFWYGASRYAKVTVTPQGRTAYEYVLSKDTAESDKFHVPLLTKNDVTITITNDKPLPFFLTGATWEGLFHSRSMRG